MSWTRVEKVGTAVTREIDEDQVERLLQERSTAKAAKEWKKADEKAKLLQELDVCYVDEKLQWYTRPVSTVQEKEKRRGRSVGPSDGRKLKQSNKKRKSADEATTTKPSTTTTSTKEAAVSKKKKSHKKSRQKK